MRIELIMTLVMAAVFIGAVLLFQLVIPTKSPCKEGYRTIEHPSRGGPSWSCEKR